uniref:DNA primase/polymerase bifunctional N-terminal domain-containing protein n=1 Tax=uncultured Nocardioidaceae bacterium TaxID=253824 RepID=A0A6J4KMM6_9ACTN|nr:MAG: hypothetical protein AVDCRST_MAG46-28 [uncultured Nocardioidaceae bacterium]
MSLSDRGDIRLEVPSGSELSGVELTELWRGTARGYAAQGYPVVPRDPDKSPAHRGRVRARADPAWIDKWWDMFPHASIGVQITGLGLVVLDEDGEEGRRSMARLLDEAGVSLPETYTVRTGRSDGGRHLWFRLPPGCPALVTQDGAPSRHPSLDVKFGGIDVTSQAEPLDLSALPAPAKSGSLVQVCTRVHTPRRFKPHERVSSTMLESPDLHFYKSAQVSGVPPTGSSPLSDTNKSAGSTAASR